MKKLSSVMYFFIVAFILAIIAFIAINYSSRTKTSQSYKDGKVASSLSSSSLSNGKITPIITSIYPSSGSVGTEITIKGSGFNFNNRKLTEYNQPTIYLGDMFHFSRGESKEENISNFKVVDDNTITFKLPQEACASNYDASDLPDGNAICVSASIIPGIYELSYYNMATTSNNIKFEVVIDKSSSHLPPIINKISAPTVLKLGQVGTWKITASDLKNGLLNYSVCWDDKEAGACFSPVSPENLIKINNIKSGQEVSFSHSFKYPTFSGFYNIFLTITDNKNLQTKLVMKVGVN